MKIALHRSLIFWFGLLVISFIFTAWVDRNSHGVNFRRHLFGTQFIVVHGQNRVLLMAAKGSSVGVQNVIDRSPTLGAKNWSEVFRPFLARNSETRDPVTNVIDSKILRLTLPHWIMVLVAAGVWLGLLVWRHRRMKRLMPQEP